jgi:hypothetical protein
MFHDSRVTKPQDSRTAGAPVDSRAAGSPADCRMPDRISAFERIFRAIVKLLK